MSIRTSRSFSAVIRPSSRMRSSTCRRVIPSRRSKCVVDGSIPFSLARSREYFSNTSGVVPTSFNSMNSVGKSL